jgi:peptide/nickel transport system substrate-binding protein
MQLALRGEVDCIKLLPKDWVGAAKTPEFEAQFNKFAYDTPAFWYIGWNQRKPFFADKNVRRAMTMMLDRETIREKILHGLAEQLTGSFIPGTDE